MSARAWGSCCEELGATEMERCLIGVVLLLLLLSLSLYPTCYDM